MLVCDNTVINEVIMTDPKTHQSSRWSTRDAFDSTKKAIATLRKLQSGIAVNSEVAVKRVDMFINTPIERLQISVHQNYKFEFDSALTPEQKTINQMRRQQRLQKQSDAVA